ncbi:MAG: alpha/beta hydrolase [Chitinophagaceae bacterium]|nr:alpha/beta hydrolase [Chitinophagaceae bacterium]MCW5929423.1 alpha/beta hydrolase [Chitinophagaceae bacterium]
MKKCIFLLLTLTVVTLNNTVAQQKVTRLSDVVYDHRDGMAFVFDVIRPAKQNGAAILYILSGGWVSRDAAGISTNSYRSYTDKGYTVFIISHGSQPRYNIPEIFSQVQRAIKFIRYNAGKYGIDPEKLGVMGHSAGGHLSVSSAVFGKDAMTEEEYRKEHNVPKEDKVDSINLVSSKIRAVACFYPPTDFIQYTSADSNWFDFPKVRNVSANGSFIATPDSARDFQSRILKSISPYYFITPQTPPVLVIHGTNDGLVPYSQSVSLITELKAHNVPCMLISKQGKDHGWPYEQTDEDACLSWFDKYLLN